MLRERRFGFVLVLVALAGCLATGVWISMPAKAAQNPSDGPAYSADGKLMRPLNYREWVYVTSGLGMTYGPAEAAQGRAPRFDNIFVTRSAYAEFMRSGKWPEKTVFILEIRRADENVSINNGGRTQGDVLAIEAAVKDRERFAGTGGWGYFSFDSREGLTDSAAPFPPTAQCYTCHEANTAVDNTFVQFYPTLFEVARKFGTVKPTYDPTRKP